MSNESEAQTMTRVWPVGSRPPAAKGQARKDDVAGPYTITDEWHSGLFEIEWYDGETAVHNGDMLQRDRITAPWTETVTPVAESSKIGPLETTNTDEPVCPFCGREVDDAATLDLQDGDSCYVACVACDNEMCVTAHVRYSYSTSKPEEPPFEAIDPRDARIAELEARVAALEGERDAAEKHASRVKADVLAFCRRLEATRWGNDRTPGDIADAIEDNDHDGASDRV